MTSGEDKVNYSSLKGTMLRKSPFQFSVVSSVADPDPATYFYPYIFCIFLSHFKDIKFYLLSVKKIKKFSFVKNSGPKAEIYYNRPLESEILLMVIMYFKAKLEYSR
jgi:hypothetical protein